MSLVDEAKEIFIHDRYAMVTTGIDIEEVGDRYAKCSLKINDGHKNAIGQVMGGAIYTLADFTFAVATNFRQEKTVTTVCQINYIGTAKGDMLFSESKLIKDGRRSCFYEIEVTDNLGNLVAVATACGMHI